jgi:hypothetical protein
LPISLKYCCRFFFAYLVICSSGLAQTSGQASSQEVAELLPDAPQAQSLPSQVQSTVQQFGTTAQQVAGQVFKPSRKYAQVIEPWQKAQTLDSADKVIFSFTEIARPITLIPAVYSASYEQIFGTDPKYGSDAAAYGEKIGAALLRRATLRVFSDGVFAATFHQDPRYYRVVDGSFLHRSWLSARQAFVRRGDDGENEFNYSGILGRAVSASMVVTYYPGPSCTARVVGLTFATSIASDMGGNLVLEFLPNIIRKFPIMEKLRLE